MPDQLMTGMEFLPLSSIRMLTHDELNEWVDYGMLRRTVIRIEAEDFEPEDEDDEPEYREVDAYMMDPLDGYPPQQICIAGEDIGTLPSKLLAVEYTQQSGYVYVIQPDGHIANLSYEGQPQPGVLPAWLFTHAEEPLLPQTFIDHPVFLRQLLTSLDQMFPQECLDYLAGCDFGREILEGDVQPALDDWRRQAQRRAPRGEARDLPEADMRQIERAVEEPEEQEQPLTLRDLLRRRRAGLDHDLSWSLAHDLENIQDRRPVRIISQAELQHLLDSQTVDRRTETGGDTQYIFQGATASATELYQLMTEFSGTHYIYWWYNPTLHRVQAEDLASGRTIMAPVWAFAYADGPGQQPAGIDAGVFGYAREEPFPIGTEVRHLTEDELDDAVANYQLIAQAGRLWCADQAYDLSLEAVRSRLRVVTTPYQVVKYTDDGLVEIVRDDNDDGVIVTVPPWLLVTTGRTVPTAEVEQLYRTATPAGRMPAPDAQSLYPLATWERGVSEGDMVSLMLYEHLEAVCAQLESLSWGDNEVHDVVNNMHWQRQAHEWLLRRACGRRPMWVQGVRGDGTVTLQYRSNDGNRSSLVVPYFTLSVHMHTGDQSHCNYDQLLRMYTGVRGCDHIPWFTSLDDFQVRQRVSLLSVERLRNLRHHPLMTATPPDAQIEYFLRHRLYSAAVNPDTYAAEIPFANTAPLEVQSIDTGTGLVTLREVGTLRSTRLPFFCLEIYRQPEPTEVRHHAPRLQVGDQVRMIPPGRLQEMLVARDQGIYQTPDGDITGEGNLSVSIDYYQQRYAEGRYTVREFTADRSGAYLDDSNWIIPIWALVVDIAPHADMQQQPRVEDQVMPTIRSGMAVRMRPVDDLVARARRNPSMAVIYEDQVPVRINYRETRLNLEHWRGRYRPGLFRVIHTYQQYTMAEINDGATQRIPCWALEPVSEPREADEYTRPIFARAEDLRVGTIVERLTTATLVHLADTHPQWVFANGPGHRDTIMHSSSDQDLYLPFYQSTFLDGPYVVTEVDSPIMEIRHAETGTRARVPFWALYAPENTAVQINQENWERTETTEVTGVNLDELERPSVVALAKLRQYAPKLAADPSELSEKDLEHRERVVRLMGKLLPELIEWAIVGMEPHQEQPV